MNNEIGRQIGKYTIKKNLGEGAVGIVWLGYDDDLDRYVAITVLKQELKDDPSIREHFRKEAKATAKLEHPNIVKIHTTSFSDEDDDYIVMEFVSPDKGTVKTLEDLLKENEGKLQPEQTEKIFVQVIEALECAHSQNVRPPIRAPHPPNFNPFRNHASLLHD
jgi:serine/threonine-protein kinase